MKSNKAFDTYEALYEYWKNHPERKGGWNVPYKENIWIAMSSLGGLFLFFDITKGRYYYHRLDGPAWIYKDLSKNPEYYVNGEFIPTKDYRKHPLVVGYVLGNLISEVLDEGE